MTLSVYDSIRYREPEVQGPPTRIGALLARLQEACFASRSWVERDKLSKAIREVQVEIDLGSEVDQEHYEAILKFYGIKGE